MSADKVDAREALSKVQLEIIARQRLTRSVLEPMLKTTWKDGIDIDEIRTEVVDFLRAVISADRALRTTPEGYQLLRSTTHDERSFPEDATSDNGNYYNTCCECGRQFTGHKRRIVCKVCTNEKPMIAAPQEGK